MGKQVVYVLTSSYAGITKILEGVFSTESNARSHIPKSDNLYMRQYWSVTDFILDESPTARTNRMNRMHHEIHIEQQRVKSEIERKHKNKWKESEDEEHPAE